MLKFTFDNDALQDLVENPDYQQLLKEIRRARERREIELYFSQTNMLELVKGVTQGNFRLLQNLLRQAIVLCGRNNLLLSPSHHLKYGLGYLSPRELAQLRANRYYDVLQMFKANDFGSFMTSFGKMREKLSSDQDVIWRQASDGVEKIRKMNNKAGQGKPENWLLSESGSSLWIQLSYEALLQLFGLEDAVSGLSREQVQERLPSLVQYAEAFRSLNHRRVVKRFRVEKGDYFDIQKVVYLDLCDYIISNDGRFVDVLNEAGTADLVGRAIKLEDFIRHLEHPCLLNRLTTAIHNTDLV